MNDDSAHSPGHELLTDYLANIGEDAKELSGLLVAAMEEKGMLLPLAETANALIGLLATILSMRFEHEDDADTIVLLAHSIGQMLTFNSLMLAQGFIAQTDPILSRTLRERVFLQYAQYVPTDRLAYVNWKGDTDAPA